MKLLAFTDQNGRPLEIEDKVNLTLIINKQKCNDILQNQKRGNMLKQMDFCHLLENIKKKLLNTELDAVEITPKKQVNFQEIKLQTLQLTQMIKKIEKKERIEEITIPPEKKDEILKKLRKVL